MRSVSSEILILCLLCGCPIQADYKLEVSFVSYSNPTNQEADGNDCRYDCSPFYRVICLRQSWYSHNDTSCPLGFPEAGFFTGTVVSIAGPGTWPVYIEVWEDEGYGWHHDLIAKVFAEGFREVNTEFSDTEFFVGGLVILGLQFRVTCINGWSGSACDECIPAGACASHCDLGWTGTLCNECVPAEGCYLGYCDQPGECICKSGWTSSLCDQCVPAFGCSPIGGYCYQPGECLCRTGWTGTLCDICTPATDCSLTGYCNQPGECLCMPGWSGVLCDECIPVSGCSPTGGYCNQPGECICRSGWSGALCDECLPEPGCSPWGGYCSQPGKCVCKTGWTGSLCDVCIPTSGCSSVGGYCYHQPGECICRSGWTGSLCDECRPAAGCSSIGGYCRVPGECLCYPGWSGVYCSQCTQTVGCCTGQFTCSSGDCIASTDQCDGIEHCSDGSDEEGCPTEGTEDKSVAIAEVTVPSAVGVILVLCVTVISVICIVLTLNRSGAKVSVEVAGETSNPERRDAPELFRSEVTVTTSTGQRPLGD